MLLDKLALSLAATFSPGQEECSLVELFLGVKLISRIVAQAWHATSFLCMPSPTPLYVPVQTNSEFFSQA